MRIIKASAGSGKTYTLARTFIAHLLGDPTGQKVMVGKNLEDKFKLRKSNFFHRHMLAITFTNKATNEMKERIINELHLLSKGEGKYVNDFKLMFEYNDFNEVIVKARQALSDILFEYSTFNVSTIDSFFQGILRNFARELDHDYNYTLELDEDYATSVAVHDFMLDLGGNHANQKAIDNWVKKYIETQYDDNKSWDFFGDSNSSNLRNFTKIIFKEFFREHYKDIIDYLNNKGNTSGKSLILQFQEKLINYRNLNLDSFRKTLKEFKQFFIDNNIPLIGLNRNSPIYKYCDNNFDPTTIDKPTDAFRRYAEQDNALERVLNRGYKENLSDAQLRGFKELVKKAVDFYDTVPFLNSVYNSLWNLGLLGKINEKLEQYRLDTNSIMIADTNELIGKILECNADFIYEHVGNTLYTYMIDEFQDTSRKQYDNFLPLLDESISRGNNNLVIGDEKQAIYRFRNSDPSILRDEIDKRFDSELTSLDDNYRSLPAIVNFNNAFFTAMITDYQNEMPQYESLIATYNNIKQDIKKTDRDGLVRINIAYSSKKDSNTHQLIVQSIPHYINSLRKRGYNLGDIAILVNYKFEGNEIVEQVLKYNDSLGSESHPHYINIVSAESLLLKNSPSVRLIISVLQFIEITHYSLNDDESIASQEDKNLLFSLIRKRVKQQRLHKMLHDFEALTQAHRDHDDYGEQLWQCFENEHDEDKLLNQEKDSEKRLMKRLEIYSSIVQGLMPNSQNQLTNLVNIVENIIDKYILKANKGNEDKIENSFILGFMNVVHDFTRQNNGGTVREFLQYWDSKKDSLAVSSPSNANAVNVMTIHKAKGLEFKCVILPFVNWDIIHVKNDELFWIKRDDWMSKISGKRIDIGNKDIVPPLIPVNYKTLNSSKLLEEIIDKDQEERAIDSLNKLYVALTRPKEELHLFSIVTLNDKESEAQHMENAGNRGMDTIKTVSDLINKYLNKGLEDINFERTEELLDCNIAEQNEEEEGVNTSEGGEDEMSEKLRVIAYRWGKEKHVEKKEEEKVPLMPTYQVSPLSMPVRTSVENSSGWASKEGIRMHEIFSHVKQLDDFDYAIRYGEANGLFKGNKYWTPAKTRQLVEEIKGDKLIMEWFDPSNVIYTERNISFPHSQDSPDHEHRRPDRMVRRPNGDIIVIDYKFGSKHDEKTIAENKEQVEKYRQLLSQMGMNNVSCYVWYLRHNEIVEV